MKTLDRGLRGQSLAARLSRVVLITVAAVGVTAPAWAAGYHTHQEIVERAIQQSAGKPYYPLLLSNFGYVYYGSMFPDWGLARDPGWFDPYWTKLTEVAHDTEHYQQNDDWREAEDNDENEATELPMFRRTLVAYAAPRAQAGSPEALAFVFGVISHQVADPAFHFGRCLPPRPRESPPGTPCPPGSIWLEAFKDEANKSHDNDPPLDHTNLEWKLDTHFLWNGIHPLPCGYCGVEWAIPAYALEAGHEGYRMSPYDGALVFPTPGALESAPEAQKRAYDAIVLSGILGSQLRQDSWTYSQIETYPHGGMADMVGLTKNAWEKTWALLRKYAPKTTEATEPLNPDGNNGWYKQPIILTLTAEDTYLGVKDYGGPFRTYYQLDGAPREEYGGEPYVVSAEGQTTLAISSVDAFENAETPKPVVLKIDRTPPLVTSVQVPAVFTRAQPLTVQLTGHDPEPGSGLLSLTAVLNQQSATPGQTIEVLLWPLGSYSLEVTAEDNAGWRTTQRQDVELVASLESLQPTVSRLCQQGFITQPGICNALSAKLEAALAARDHGNLNAMVGALNAFQNAVNAQAGKAISTEAVALLLADSGYVLAH